MPNHVKHRMTIVGATLEVRKVLKSIATGDDLFDFNNVIPMPKELENTQSPVKIISSKEYVEQEKRIKQGELTKEEKSFGISRGLTETLSKLYKKRFGADNWYDWQIENWGTKWSAYDIALISTKVIRKDELGIPLISKSIMEFNTAWSTPFVIFAKLSSIFPNVEFLVEFADEDFGYNVGAYLFIGGIVQEENIPEGGTEAAYEMALRIKDDDYMITEYLSELSNNELDADYAQALIKLAHKKRKLVENYPIKVLEQLKELALGEEQYERVQQIDKLLSK